MLLSDTASVPGQREAIVPIGRLLADSKLPAPVAFGHRPVHGGPRLQHHCPVDDVLHQLEAAIAIPPLHIPSALSVIGFAREHFPAARQVACFDTASHADLPEVARVLRSLPCESIVRQFGDDLPDRLVIAQTDVSLWPVSSPPVSPRMACYGLRRHVTNDGIE